MIICVMFIGWIVIFNRPLTLIWTKNFLRIGGLWGIFAGIMIIIIPWLRNQIWIVRTVIGIIMGVMPVVIMVNDLTESHDRFRVVFGVLGGIICSVIVPVLKPPLQPPLKRQLKDFSSTNGAIIAGTLGFILAMIWGIALITSQPMFLREIIMVYLLPMIMASIGAVYGYIKPITNDLAKKIERGLVEGLIFGSMAIVYLGLMIVSEIINFPNPKDSIMGTFLGGLLMTIFFGMPTMILGGIVGWVGEWVTQILIKK